MNVKLKPRWEVARKRPHSLWSFLTLAAVSLSLTSCFECLGSPFTFSYFANGTLVYDFASVQTPTTIKMGASSRFEPECRTVVTVNKVAFFWGSQQLAVDTEVPFEYIWNVQSGEDGVPVSGAVTRDFYAVANDQYPSNTAKLEVRVATTSRMPGVVLAVRRTADAADTGFRFATACGGS
jgi:hypothetical protein